MKKKLILIILSWCISFSLFAQSNHSLTLSDAITKALENNYDIRIYQQDVLDAQQQNTWGNAGRLPQINFSNRNRGTSQINQPASPFSLEGQNDNIQLDAAIDLQWILFNGQKVSFQKQQLENQEKLTSLQYRSLIENKIEEVVFQYYKVLLEQEKLNVLRTIQLNASLRISRLEKGVLLGENSRFELTREKTTYFTDSVNLVDQKLTVENDLRELNYLLGEQQINKVFHLSDSLQVPTLELSSSIIFDKVNTQNSQLRISKSKLEQNEIDIKLNKTTKIPTISLESGYQGNLNWLTAGYPTIEGDIITQTNKGHLYGGFVGLNMTIPIFKGGQNDRKIQSSKIQYHKSHLGFEQKKLDLKKEFNQLFASYTYNQKKVQIGLQSQQAAAENLQLSQAQLDLGSISAFDFRQVQNSYMNASLNYFNAQYELILSQVRLLKISGEIIK
ncbi:TolC family protein [Flammeovirga kamogawensis]|uniref:TolC family protein n=1 Tax=Flammeovirga kamogawensis TaxID=373891 RepID=A0ABX8GRS3_9BACT|nr:TolC family protein [Flammeovirga kamogawensis]MBB6461379.1 outer membrane protein TolC [Flammeovirga kamogawensis]QWG06280.1 TolC family protein [Flammeovirga kamogawensis]